MKDCKNIAVILSGGSGSRMGGVCPKQFQVVAGKCIIEHTIDIFERNDRIDEIAVVVNENYIDYFEEIALKNSWKKVKKILKGGDERYHSTLAAIDAYSEFPGYNLIFHDAVRPLVNDRIIDEVIAALTNYEAVGVAFPSIDTIVKVDESERFVESIPNRKFLYRVQTPQAFKQRVIAEAYRMALNDTDAISATDDCGIVSKYMPEVDIFVVRGEADNFKVTYADDLLILDTLIRCREKL